MAYRDFTVQEVVRRFQLVLDETHDLFSPVVDLPPSALLRETLAENVPLALAMLATSQRTTAE